MSVPREEAQRILRESTKELSDHGIDIGEERVQPPAVAPFRRRRLAPPDTGGFGFLSLICDSDGVLDWRVDGGVLAAPSRRARRGSGGRMEAATDQVIDQVPFKRVAGSQVSSFLSKLDTSFNKRRGFFDLDGNVVPAPPVSGRVLLIVHGTFSKCDAIVDQLRNVAGHATLLDDARKLYSAVLVFEHPTLAVSPIHNALEITRYFAKSKAKIDVICHSRGGLVVRWWLEAFERDRAGSRVVFVGSPLQGTGLASPLRLRSALKVLTNYSVALGKVSGLASMAVPLFGVVQGLMTVVGSVTGALANAPVFDAAIAMIPGLAAQSLCGPDSDSKEIVEGNFDLTSLSAPLGAVPASYFFVQSNFEPEKVGWKLWRVLASPGARLADAAADGVFSGDNDLVVDTRSMSMLGPNAVVVRPNPKVVLEFGANDGVHHLNYFQSPLTCQFLKERLFDSQAGRTG